MPVSLTDVAKAAGVSVATVSRVLTGINYPVTSKTRAKVLKAARELGYQPNLIARSLRTEQSHTIGLIVENILSPFIPSIIRGIQDRLEAEEYYSIILNADWDPVAETAAVEHLRMRQIDGIIFVESFLRTSAEVSKLIDRPYFFVHRLFNSLHANSVVPDDRYGARLAVRHLAQLGHRRIAYINGPADWDAAKNRLAGYREELAEWDITPDPAYVIQGDWGLESGYAAVQTFLQATPRPTAIFACNDMMALGAIYAAQDRGLTVPDDLAVVGYDDREFSDFVRPGITTVQMPCEQMGQIAAESLLRLIHGESQAPEPILVPGRLIVRQSCGAPGDVWTACDPEQSRLTKHYFNSPRSLSDKRIQSSD